LETNPKRRGVLVKGGAAIVLLIAVVGAFYLIRQYTGFGGYPLLQVQSWNPTVERLSTNGTAQYTWELNPQILIQNRGVAAASDASVLWSISGGPLTGATQGISKVGTLVPGSNLTVSWTFSSGLTSAPFPTYIVTATLEYVSGPNIVATVTLTPPASCVQAPPSTPCG
jgi:hypothetical protein